MRACGPPSARGPAAPAHTPQAAFSVGYGAVFDSGTTFSYLPSPVFRAFTAALGVALAGKGLTKGAGPDPAVRRGVALLLPATRRCPRRTCSRLPSPPVSRSQRRQAKLAAHPPPCPALPGPSRAPQYPDVCWRGAPDGFAGLDAIFPTARLVFGGGAALTLRPHRYLFLVARGEYCLGVFDNGAAGTLIGGIAVRNALVQARAGRGARGAAHYERCAA